ncbi:MAG: YlmC/YmxH family sporulation protein [Ruminococcus sp.]|nr:YlmC/YmxH family sporulation protein [Ruminococcus sp.]MBR2303834.1 YlmC/YmxH family sporulation protein [Ruminococcus sp.]
MTVSFSQLRMKEIVNVSTGMKIGYADDIELDTETSEVISITVFGRQRAFGLMGRDEDIVIKCSDIKLVGEDTILVDMDERAISTKEKSVTVENLLK